MWKYIRAAGLQDPKDRRKIKNDDKMFRVFKCKTMNMMHIAKKLSPHLKKYSELVVGDDETTASRGSAALKGEEDRGGQRKIEIRAWLVCNPCTSHGSILLLYVFRSIALLRLVGTSG